MWNVRRPLALLALGILSGAAGVRPSGAAGAPEVVRWGALEKLALFGGESAPQWNVAECTVEASPAHVRVGKMALHWHVPVDYTAGEAGYPVGWPRFNHPIPEGALRDWSRWDYLHFWVYADTSRDELPSRPAGIILEAPDRAAEWERALTTLRKGQWIECTIPVSALPNPRDVRLIQFYLSESDYRDKDTVDFYIDDLALFRYATPTLLDYTPETQVVFSDAKELPVTFRLTGLPAGGSCQVASTLERNGNSVARVAARLGRGPARMVLDLTSQVLPPGTYQVVGRVTGGREVVRAQVRVVASPWK